MTTRWFGWRGFGCLNGDRLIYLSQRWQVLRVRTPGLKAWRVPGFGWGVRVAWIDVVRLPK